MPISHVYRATILSAVLASLFIAQPPTSGAASTAEKPVPAEKNPPGDIPDSQVFIDYISKDGFSLKVPEGWARTDRPDGASFVDKLDGVVLTRSNAAQAPTVESVRKDYLPAIQKESRAAIIDSVKAVRLPAGKVIHVAYESNSAPNEVTDRQVRLENQRFLFFKDGKLVTLELYAPFGADNVDQWKLISESFRWR
jgi:hypothetical protein